MLIGKFWATYSKWSEFRFGSESIGNGQQPPVLSWVKEYVTTVDALKCHVDPPSAKKDLLLQTAESGDFRQNLAPLWSWKLPLLKGNVLSRPDVFLDTTCIQLLLCLRCDTKAWSQLPWVWPRPHAWLNFCSSQACFFSFFFFCLVPRTFCNKPLTYQIFVSDCFSENLTCDNFQRVTHDRKWNQKYLAITQQVYCGESFKD